MQSDCSLFYPFLINRVPAGESIRSHKHKLVEFQTQIVEKFVLSDKKSSKSRSQFPAVTNFYMKNSSNDTTTTTSQVIIV